MKILVTGGAGFIGSNFINLMTDKYSDDNFVCVDKLTYAGNISNIKESLNRENFKFIRADITDEKKMDAIFGEECPDIVINFAAETHVDRSIKNPGEFLDTNILGTRILLDASIKYGIKRYHQISTDEVYGDLPIDRPDLLFSEDSCIKTSSPYSASKASADLLVGAYFKTYGLPTTISRCSNNYGPYQFPEKLIPLMILNILQSKSLPIYGDGMNVRDWIFVDDHCRAVDLIVRNGIPGETYNIGASNEKSNLEIVYAIIKELGKGAELITFIKDRMGHDRRYAIDSSKIRNELRWKPGTTFEEGIKSTVSWYLENKIWWEEILKGEYKNYYDRMYKNK